MRAIARSHPGVILLAGCLTACLPATDAAASRPSTDAAASRPEGPARIGGVPRSGTPSPDSNMGFSTSVRLAASSADGSPFLLALPLFPGTDDIADAGAPSPC